MTTPPFDSDLHRHVAGATVVHAGPYSSIEVPQSLDSLSPEFIARWVAPFYRVRLAGAVDKFARAMKPLVEEIGPDIYLSLLTEVNWRPRMAAAYFAAILREVSVEEHLGKLLLRSDVCYVGGGYCLAMARFNTPSSVHYLKQYLSYYLKRPDLYFDQGAAVAAVLHLDKKNQTDTFGELSESWEAFAASRSEGYGLAALVERFDEELGAIDEIAREVSA